MKEITNKLEEENINKCKGKKTKSIIGNLIFYIFVAVLIFIITGATIAKKNNTCFYIFNYSFSIVVTDSMENTIMVGDLVICKKAVVSDVKENDIVLFRSNAINNYNMKIIHRAVEIENIGEETRIYTQGDNAIGRDDGYRTDSDVLGIFVCKSTFLGKIASFLTNWINLVFILAIFFTLKFALKQIKNLKKENLNSESNEDNKNNQNLAEEESLNIKNDSNYKNIDTKKPK